MGAAFVKLSVPEKEELDVVPEVTEPALGDPCASLRLWL
jgi:hypothetical protein